VLDRVIQHLFQVGLSLQAAADLPGKTARERLAEAMDRGRHRMGAWQMLASGELASGE